MGSTAQLSASARQMPVRQLTALVAALEVDEAPAAAPAQKKMSMSRRDRVRERGPSDARDAREGELPLGASCNARPAWARICVSLPAVARGPRPGRRGMKAGAVSVVCVSYPALCLGPPDAARRGAAVAALAAPPPSPSSLLSVSYSTIASTPEEVRV